MSRDSSLFLHTNVAEFLATIRRYHAIIRGDDSADVDRSEFLELVQLEAGNVNFASAYCNPRTFGLFKFELKEPEIARAAIELADAYLIIERAHCRDWGQATHPTLCELERLTDSLGKALGLDAPVRRSAETVKSWPERVQLDDTSKIITIDGEQFKLPSATIVKLIAKLIKAEGDYISSSVLQSERIIPRDFRLDVELKKCSEFKNRFMKSKRGSSGGYCLELPPIN